MGVTAPVVVEYSINYFLRREYHERCNQGQIGGAEGSIKG